MQNVHPTIQQALAPFRPLTEAERLDKEAWAAITAKAAAADQFNYDRAMRLQIQHGDGLIK
jgi:hypothetical protein